MPLGGRLRGWYGTGMSNRTIVYESQSPNGEWELRVLAPTETAPEFYATFKRVGEPGGIEFPFGFTADPTHLKVSWDLPDNVCGLYVKDECYGLFRYGARRRRRRERFRVGEDKPFAQEEIAWMCKKKRTQQRYRKARE